MEIMTIEDAARLSGRSVKTIRRQIAEGSLKADKVNNKYRIEKSDYDNWYTAYINGELGKESILMILIAIIWNQRKLTTQT